MFPIAESVEARSGAGLPRSARPITVGVVSGAPIDRGDGVGDFSWLLARELAIDAPVTLVVPGRVPEAEEGEDSEMLTLRSLPPGWSARTCREMARLVETLQPDVLLVHYAPDLFGWWGAKPFFVGALAKLARRGCRIVSVAHEFSAPYGVAPTAWVRAAAHRVLLGRLVRSSARVVLTTDFCRAQMARWYPVRQDLFCDIPVSTTVPVVPITDEERRTWRADLGIGAYELLIATFGSPVEPGCTLFRRLMTGLVLRWPFVRLVIVGKHGDTIRRQLSGEPAVLARTRATGSLGREAVSRYLSASDLFVAIYPDGASTRRTSLMAALAHGVPTLANQGPLTDAALAGSGALAWIDGRGAFNADEIARLLTDRAERQHLGKAGRALFDRDYSWPAVSARYRELLQEVSAG